MSTGLSRAETNLLFGFHKGLKTLEKGVYDFVGAQVKEPQPGCQAFAEDSAFPKDGIIPIAWGASYFLLELGAEHVSLLLKSLQTNIEINGCYTCVRSMMESCAIAAWLTDPSIDVHERAKRTFAYRFEGMEKQLSLAHAIKSPASDIQKMKDRIDAVEKDALGLGYPAVVDRKGKRIGIGMQMPSATTMIDTITGEGTVYRLLSGIAHGHSWAITQLSYKRNPAHATGKDQTLEKSINVGGFGMMMLAALNVLSRVVWNHSQYLGWDLLKIEEVFENSADAMWLDESRRFWRSPIAVK